MKLSPYHVYVANHSGQNQGLLYSTLNGTAVSIEHSLYGQLHRGISNKQLLCLPGELSRVLCSYFLISDKKKHRQEVFERIQKSVFSRKRFALTALLTSDCNFRCSYCYQSGILQRGKRMRYKTVILILQWLKEQLTAVTPQMFEIHLYGGEPLLNPSALRSLLIGSRKICSMLGIRFGAYITTNGYLLTPGMAEDLVSLGVGTALISLDGPMQVHNKRRCLVNGKGSFRRILDNIVLSTRELNICVRINIDKQNAGSVADLLKILARYKLQERISIDIEIISPVLFPTAHVKEFLFYNDDDLRSIEHLWEECAKYGFRIFGVMPIEGACEHRSVNTYTVDPEGFLYECPGFIGLSKFRIGYIGGKGVIMRSRRSGQVNRPWLKCGDCAYQPVCQGGCRMCNYVTKRELKTPFCKRDFFERTYPSFLKAKYKNELLSSDYSKK